MSKQQPIVEITEDKIAIYTPEKAEIVMWDKAEWEEDPSIVSAIANAIHLAYSEGTVALIETIHPDYIDGYGCPRCFSENTETVLGLRQNTCCVCQHEFPLPEKLAQEIERDHPGHDIDVIDEPAQGRAFLQYLSYCAKYNIDPPEDLPCFIDLALAQQWTFTEDGKRKYKEV